jgi:hypothetical protein
MLTILLRKTYRFTITNLQIIKKSDDDNHPIQTLIPHSVHQPMKLIKIIFSPLKKQIYITETKKIMINVP